MKRFEVIVTPQAEADILSAFQYIHDRSPFHAAHWIYALYAEIETLEYFPERCGYAREREYVELALRQLIVKSRRIIFLVDSANAVVQDLHVKLAKQLAVGEPDLEGRQ